MTTWGEFADAEPELAAFVAERLGAVPPYLATVDASGSPRVHPVTPIFTYGDERLPERRRWRAPVTAAAHATMERR